MLITFCLLLFFSEMIYKIHGFSPYVNFFPTYTPLTKSIQSNVINAQLFTPLNITTQWHEQRSTFLFSKPSFGEYKNIHLQAYLEKAEGPVLWLKMKSQPAYLEKFCKIKCNEPVDGAKTNKMIMDRELQKFPGRTLDVCYLDDICFGNRKTTVVNWFERRLLCNYNYDEEKLYIQSPTLLTSEKFIIKRYAGMYYMKLLTPSLANYFIQNYGKPVTSE